MKNKIIINFPAADKTETVITIGKGEASKLIKKKQAYIVADKRLVSLYPLFLPSERVFLTDGGEDAKSPERLEKLLEWLSNNKCTRSDSIIAVGGGTIGDLAGFAAAVYMRGVRWSVIPTTLLSMTDSSVGGKTAVNIGGVKNLAGAFHQPDRVAIDPSFLITMPDREYLSGMGEVIKTAVIADKPLFYLLFFKQDNIRERDISIMKKIIFSCCRYKGKIVSSDARESEKRTVLNAGHTIAHAIERDSRCIIPHGQAVAIGLYYETLIGEKLGYCEKNTAAKIAGLLSLYDCPVSYLPSSYEQFVRTMAADKKQQGKYIYIPFVKKIGKTVIKKLDTVFFCKEFFKMF